MNGRILVELQEHMGSDASIANAAWTSTYDKWKRDNAYDDPDKIAKLVPRLIREGHSTPIESVVLRFWIRMPIFTDRQHMTHRIASHNGLSGRYRTVPNDWFGFPQDCQDIVARGSGSKLTAERMARAYDELCEVAFSQYDSWLGFYKSLEAAGKITNAEYKRLRETARAVIPTAFMVERTSILNLRSFANYIRLRNSDHAQPEIRSVAAQMLAEVKRANVCPIAIATLEEVGWRI